MYTVETGAVFVGPEDQPTPAFYVLQMPKAGLPSMGELITTATLGAVLCHELDRASAEGIVNAIRDPEEGLYRAPTEIADALRPVLYKGFASYITVQTDALVLSGEYLTPENNTLLGRFQAAFQDPNQRTDAGCLSVEALDADGFVLNGVYEIEGQPVNPLDPYYDIDYWQAKKFGYTYSSWRYQLAKSDSNEPVVKPLLPNLVLGDLDRDKRFVSKAVVDNELLS